MSDQQPPQNGDTAAVAGPDEASGTAQDQVQSDPYEKRYNDLRPEFDRATAERNQLAERQQWYEVALTADDEDTRRQALEFLGYQLAETDEQETYSEDPYEQLAQRQEAFEQRLTQREQQEEEARQTDLIRSITDERLSQLPDLATEDQDWILAYAINALPALHEPGVPVPLPDIQSAYDAFAARETERQKGWAKTKRAPYIPPGGRDATEAPDPGTGHQARLNRALLSLRNSVGDE
jgi:hypothetical protein